MQNEEAPVIDIFDNKTYIEEFLDIRTKKNEIVPFLLNEPQKRLLEIIEREESEGRPVRVVILKARQMGFSTLTEGIIFKNAATRFNITCAIITHVSTATANLYRMIELFYDRLPDFLKPMKRKSNTKMLLFENPTKSEKEKAANPGLGSSIKCFTAGSKGVGRSDTITCLHASEYAFWESTQKVTKDQILQGILQAVPKEPGTIVVIESTANGFEEFKDLWDSAVRGEIEFIPLFFAWYELKEYRMPYDGFELTVEEKSLKERYNLDNEQIAWRRWCIRANCGGKIEVFKQEYPSNPEEAFLTSGSPVFDNEAILIRLGAIRERKPVRQGFFVYEKGIDDKVIRESIKWIDDPAGEIKIFEEPKIGTPYVIGGDTAGDGSDFFSGIVINNVTAMQAATLKRKYDEDQYTEQMICLGCFYNTALIGIEKNYSTHPNKILQRNNYPHIFRTQNESNISDRMQDSYGFKTDSITRPLIIAELVTFVREHTEMIFDADVLREMLDFVKVKGRPEARAGKHDDLVMAYAIANHLRRYQSCLPYEEVEEYSDDSIDEMLDYGM